MKNYEISVWEDLIDSSGGFYDERKLAVIGSDTMDSPFRAQEPRLTSNINGTNKFTFKMMYSFVDAATGEQVTNPFIQYLVNERRIKVKWKDEWYDLVIKSSQEDSSGRSIVYTCEDLYLTELSRTGFNLEFNTELQNNIGTASELVGKVLEGTDWTLAESDTIYQKLEEAVYETTVEANFTAKANPANTDISIKSNYQILVFYSVLSDQSSLNPYCQFLYSEEGWQTDANNMLVLNGTCCSINVSWSLSNNIATAYLNGTKLFQVDLTALSTNYRAERYVRSQKTKYSRILERYVNVYDYAGGSSNLLGYETTEYNDALAVVNLISNPSNFSNTSGWIGTNLKFQLSPKFGTDTSVTTYSASSYLQLYSDGSTSQRFKFNSAIQSNRQYLPNGFAPGDTFIFRCKVKEYTTGEPASSSYIHNFSRIVPSVQNRNEDYLPTGSPIFNVTQYTLNGDWMEYTMVCTEARTYTQLITTSLAFFLEVPASCWLEEAQFFKYIVGDTGSGTQRRIDPGEMSMQSVAQAVWKYYYAVREDDSSITKDNLDYVYTCIGEWSSASPVYNDFIKTRTIEESQSNRFNILQTIAEAFECWVKFIINHDETGKIIRVNGVPQKYIKLVEEVGEETGIGFIYGIDLKTVERTIKSNQIATKTIVLQNENEFGDNGFCSIARSELNFPRENFILNFDYFINQGLLSREQLNKDLYTNQGLNYFTNLHNLNVEYMQIVEDLLNKNTELTKQEAADTVYTQYITSAQNERAEIENDILKLANANTMEEAEAYIRTHCDNTKIQTLMNDRTVLINTIKSYQQLQTKIESSIATLKAYITTKTAREAEIITALETHNLNFYKKYSRYIQEGTWTSEDYYNDDLYYLDGCSVAYTSSRPEVTYDISVVRLSESEDYKYKIFKLGDICYVQDTEFFGWQSDGITPYKEKVLISEVTSYFDQPDKDTLKIQNYKTQFDDLFQRVAAATKSLEFSEGKYTKSANVINTDGTLKSSVVQKTFDSNSDLVLGAQNESVTIDNTGITTTDKQDASKRVKVTSGGIFVSSDGGTSWNNAIRSDGITADMVTTGNLNTDKITIWGGDTPSFGWDQNGISAYFIGSDGKAVPSKFVRFDKYGIYGLNNSQVENYNPASEQQIYNDATFGLTWSRFFMKSSEGGRSIEISTDKDIVVNDGAYDRVVIGRVDPNDDTNYGMIVRNQSGETVFECDSEQSILSGWKLTEDALESKIATGSNSNIKIQSDGNIGCYGHGSYTMSEKAYDVVTTAAISATGSESGISYTIPSGTEVFVFSSYIGDRFTTKKTNAAVTEAEKSKPSSYPSPANAVQIYSNYGSVRNYEISGISWTSQLATCTTTEQKIESGSGEETTITYISTYTYKFNLIAKQNGNTIFTIPYSLTAIEKQRYIGSADTKWKIDNTGHAEFYDIDAKYGKIAGWFIDEDKIYRTSNGERDGEIVTQLSSSGSAESGGTTYTIATDALESLMASMGGVLLQNGLVNGYSLAEMQASINNLWSALNNLAYKYNNHTHTYKRLSSLKAVEAHTHSFTASGKISACSGTTSGGSSILPSHTHTFGCELEFTGGDDTTQRANKHTHNIEEEKDTDTSAPK